MERESFIFYKSFYEAIKDLPKDIYLEVLTAIIEYGLYGREPEELKPFARGMFMLVRPILDINNTRYSNGKKGGRKKKPTTIESPESSAPSYNLTYKEEIDLLRSNSEINESICKDFDISTDEYLTRLSKFLTHCIDEGKKKRRKGHTSADDVVKHLRYWMTKAFPKGASPNIKSTSTTANAEIDYTSRLNDLERQSRQRRIEFDKQAEEKESPADMIRRMGYDPEKVSIAQVLNPDWREKNPPALHKK